jgi:hypothetical protein
MRPLTLPLLAIVSLQGCSALASGDHYHQAMNELAAAKGDKSRFYALDAAAKESFLAGHVEDARTFAKELLEISSRFKQDWNYGNAIHDGNLVLGRIAVKEGRLDEAKKCLLEAGKSKGSPQMDTFGPNMSLAKDLLEKGERETVLEYFELCRKFWKIHRGRLDDWSALVKQDVIPDFGANLFY